MCSSWTDAKCWTSQHRKKYIVYLIIVTFVQQIKLISLSQAGKYKSTCNCSLLYIEPLIFPEWQPHTPTDQLTRHFNLKSNHRSYTSWEGRQSERLFIFISLVSDGLSASWTGGAGNTADCDSFRLQSKTWNHWSGPPTGNHKAAVPGDGLRMFFWKGKECETRRV